MVVIFVDMHVLHGTCTSQKYHLRIITEKGVFLTFLMLYSLCMKFQAELVKFQDQLENRVLCKTFPSRQNSEVHPSVTTHEELKNAFESYNY